MGHSLYELFYNESDASTVILESSDDDDDEFVGAIVGAQQIEQLEQLPVWYADGLEDGHEGSQWPMYPPPAQAAPATPTNQPTRNNIIPDQRSKYQRAKDSGYYQCLQPECEKRRTSHSRHCRQHGGRDQECRVDGCVTRARHRGLCKKHAPAEQKPRCSFDGCDNIAQSRGLCHSHNPGIRKCTNCHIVRPAYYAPVCTRCRGPRASAAETLFRAVITAKYPDARLNRRLVLTLRPDVVLYTVWGGVLCLEIDEDCHTLYTAEHEVEREIKIARALNQPVIFMRLNPDTVKDRNGRTIRRGLRQRFEAFMEDIEDLMVRRPRGVRLGRPFTITYYYTWEREQELLRVRRTFNI